MSAYRYKAYLSYSHQDAVWAAWLHRALETYRMPSSLVGTEPNGRKVPVRLTPIFRDRDDLSSVASLSAGLQQALRESESLIVICSPSAAASRWVNEEISYFRSLGRADRIFCVLVAGESTLLPTANCGFPPALLVNVNGPALEPLAVDPRPYADGRELAKLKLIAGLVGVRLDDLRRRELKRKRRWQALVAGGALCALTLMMFALLARQAEQRERYSAEQMAGFIVDLGEELKSDIGLEALGLISSRAMSYLADINPQKLRPETAVKVGLALRQIGQVSDGQGRSEEAIEAFLRSRDLFADLHERQPQSTTFLFELGQAEFYVASYFLYAGQVNEALPRARRYAQISEQLYNADPENAQWQLELSYAATGLLVMEVRGRSVYTSDILSQADRAVRLARDVLSQQPDDTDVINNYSYTLAWVADARMLACDVTQALEARQETVEMAEKALQNAPGDNYQRESYAYAKSGVAVIEAQLGHLDKAQEHWRASIAAMESLWREDRSNERLRRELLLRRIYLARALLDNNDANAATKQLASVGADLRLLTGDSSSDPDTELARELHIVQARVAQMRGEDEVLRKLVLDRVSRLKDVDPHTWSAEERAAVAELYYHWWRTFGTLPEGSPTLPLNQITGLRTCRNAVANARIALVQDQPDRARDELEYLHGKGYRAADALAICREVGQCPQLTSH